MKNSITLQLTPGSVIGVRKKMFAIMMLLIAMIAAISCSKNPDMLAEPVTNEDGAGETVGISAGATYYLSPTGNDANNGSISAPFKTLNKAWTVVTAGDIIYMRGGTYEYNSAQFLEGKNGTSTSPIKVWAYPGEIPVITDGTSYSGQDLIYFEGNYVHWKGLELANFRRADFGWYAFRSEASNNCTYELMHVHHNRSSLGIRGNSTGNLVLNSDFHHNADPEDGYGGSDGLNISLVPSSSATNTIRGCRSWYNSDDGFDTWENEGYVLIENCWSWNNGYVEGTFNPAGDGGGFKLGLTKDYPSTLKRTIKNSIAWKNRNYGFNENHSLATHNLYNNTSVSNGSQNFTFGWWGQNTTIAKNNISYKGGGSDQMIYGTFTNNSWNGKTVTDADFKSMDGTQLLRSRKSDGSLPDIDFLQLVAGSDLIDAGAQVSGIAYNGSAPDIGALESGGVAAPPPPGNQPPIANAGSDKTITLPTNNTSLTGSGSDPGGSIAAYAWTRISGPNTPTLSGSNSTTLTASNLVAGNYVFRLTVTDNLGVTGYDDANVVVNSAGTPPPPPGTNLINVSQALLDAGYNYYVGQDFGTAADISTSTTRSTLRIFENGVELNPAHSKHNDIATLGRGRFSHWSDGSYTALYFSSSDNTDPRTNGRTYTYSTGATAPPPPPPPPPPTPGLTPYGGTARAIPGTIQAEDYDNGGQNLAYYDKSTGNSGAEYRTTEAVDVAYDGAAGSYVIGWTQSGEWLKYSVNVTSSGNYTIQAKVASPAGSRSIRIEMDGVTIATVAIPNTGGSSVWRTISVTNIPLTAGNKVMRIYNVTGSQSINSLTFVKQ